MPLPTEVFISHSSQDQEFVTTLVAMLDRHGIPIWYSKTNIRGAQQWHDEIGNALSRCDWFLLVLSPRSLPSMWVKRELLYALQQDRLVGKIVPIMYKSCDYERLSWVLSSLQVVDFQQDFEAASRELLRIWSLGYKRDTAE